MDSLSLQLQAIARFTVAPGTAAIFATLDGKLYIQMDASDPRQILAPAGTPTEGQVLTWVSGAPTWV